MAFIRPPDKFRATLVDNNGNSELLPGACCVPGPKEFTDVASHVTGLSLGWGRAESQSHVSLLSNTPNSSVPT